MQLFCRVIGDLDQIRFAVREDQVGLASKNAEIFARLIDGDFQYEAVIPAGGNRIEADADTFARKLRLVSNVSGEETRAVRLREGEHRALRILRGRGEATAHMDVDFKGEDGDIAFNPDYVLDGIKNGAPRRSCSSSASARAPASSTWEEHVYIVMPITLET